MKQIRQKNLFYFREYRNYAVQHNIDLLYCRRKMLFDRLTAQIKDFRKFQSISYYDYKISVVNGYMEKVRIIDEQIEDIKNENKDKNTN